MWNDSESLERQIARGKNPGDVWDIATIPYKGSHTAVFPPSLVEPMIKAACPAEICPVCGLPRERIVSNEVVEPRTVNGVQNNTQYSNANGNDVIRCGVTMHHTVGWATCNCGAGYVAGTVLDPFAGSGTVGEVARKLGRNAILLELNPDYEVLIKERIMAHTPPLTAYFGDD